MNAYELLIIAIILILVVNAVIFLIRGRRKGKNGCGCDRSCSHCEGCSQPNVIIDEGDGKE
ncbi:MAG: FeoB-associated Cys-rich membrane protein [Thermoplasmata archaeon]|nr:FeoB-associated Cys-rich membrane protein [Thermoplasmata archaeon]